MNEDDSFCTPHPLSTEEDERLPVALPCRTQTDGFTQDYGSSFAVLQVSR